MSAACSSVSRHSLASCGKRVAPEWGSQVREVPESRFQVEKFLEFIYDEVQSWRGDQAHLIFVDIL